MTLIEILVVLAIIGLIVGGVSVVAFNAFGEPRSSSGYNDVINVQKACEQYMLQKNDKCPKSLQDLKAAGVISRARRTRGARTSSSPAPASTAARRRPLHGPDKKQGGDDDIVSWESPKEKDDEEEGREVGAEELRMTGRHHGVIGLAAPARRGSAASR
jgi:general secretion pathway protein G